MLQVDAARDIMHVRVPLTQSDNNDNAGANPSRMGFQLREQPTGDAQYVPYAEKPGHDYLTLASLNTDLAVQLQAQEKKEADERNRKVDQAESEIAAYFDGEITALTNSGIDLENQSDALKALQDAKTAALAAIGDMRNGKGALGNIREIVSAALASAKEKTSDVKVQGLLSTAQQAMEFYGQAAAEYRQTTKTLNETWSKLDKRAEENNRTIYGPTGSEFIPPSQMDKFKDDRAKAEAKAKEADQRRKDAEKRGDILGAATALVDVADAKVDAFKVDAEAAKTAAENAQKALDAAIARGDHKEADRLREASAKLEAAKAEANRIVAEAQQAAAKARETLQTVQEAKSKKLAEHTEGLTARHDVLAAQPNSPERNAKLAALDSQIAAANVETVALKTQQEILAKRAMEEAKRTTQAQARIAKTTTVQSAQVVGDIGSGDVTVISMIDIEDAPMVAGPKKQSEAVLPSSLPEILSNKAKVEVTVAANTIIESGSKDLKDADETQTQTAGKKPDGDGKAAHVA